MGELYQDLSFSLRTFLKRPGFLVIVVATLALGIGMNTAIFSVVNAVLLRPLPFREPERLVRIHSEFPTMNLRKFWMSVPEYLDIRKESKSWAAIGVWREGGVNVGTSGEPLRVTAARVNRDLIEALGVAPALGRNFTPEEDRVGGAQTAIISDSLWRTAFAAAPDIIGREIRVNERPTIVVGVMPREFSFPPGSNDVADVFAPFQFDPAQPGGRASHFLNVIGRLNDGVSIQQARSEMDILAAAWKAEKRATHLLSPPGHPVLMGPLHEDVTGGARRAVLVLLAAVGFVLLIACANVASLLLARAESRHRELAVRLALGASRARMLRQFLTEGLILVVIGTSAGVLLAQLGLKLIMATAPDSVPRTGEIRIDLWVLAFTTGISVLAVIAFGLAPMLQLRDRGLSSWLHGSSHRASGGGQRAWVRKSLVVIEVALAVILVVGSGLMIRAFWKLQQVNLGFNPESVLSFSIQLPPSIYANPDRLRFAQQLEQKLAAIPGVTSAAAAGELPPLRSIDANDTDFEDYRATPETPAENVDFWNIVGTNYFKAMGIRKIDGRTFESSDDNEKAQRVVVINETLARRFFKGDPIGRRLNPSNDPPTWFTVVGVVEDTKNLGVDKPAGTELYFLQTQAATALGGLSSQLNFVIKGSGSAPALASAVRTAVREINPALPVYELKTMSDLVSESVVRPRFLSILLSIFSMTALLLAAVGIYGVMSYSVSQRTQEIGVRMALGARTSSVLGMVLSQGIALSAIGLGIGLAGALALARFMAGLLFEVSVTDSVDLRRGDRCALTGRTRSLSDPGQARNQGRPDDCTSIRMTTQSSVAYCPAEETLCEEKGSWK